MAGTIDRLTYLKESYTQSTISEMTGIPQSTLSYVIRGLRELPVQYFGAVVNTFQTEAYRRLTTAGSPSLEAETVSRSTVDLARDKEQFIHTVANQLTMGYIIRSAVNDDAEITQSYIDDNWSTAYGDIVNSLRNSTLPVDDWKDYLGDNPSWLV